MESISDEQPIRVSISFAALSPAVDERLTSALSELFPYVEPSHVVQLGVDPSSWVQIVADVLTWSVVFKSGAAAFAIKFGERIADKSADVMWDGVGKLYKGAFKSSGLKQDKVEQLARALEEASQIGSRPVKLSVGLPIPSWGQSLYVSIPTDNSEALREKLSTFFLLAPALERAARGVLVDEGRVLGLMTADFNSGGFDIRWFSHRSNTLLGRSFDFDGVAAGAVGKVGNLTFESADDFERRLFDSLTPEQRAKALELKEARERQQLGNG